MSKIKKALERAKAEAQHEYGTAVEEQKNVASEKETGPVKYYRSRVIDIPRDILINNKIVAVDDSNPVVDCFKLLRTRILNRTRPDNLNAIQVSGFGVDEGKSLVAANLAVCMAKDTRQTTLIVDMDFRRPSIHRLFGLGETVKGLVSYFNGEVVLEDLFINPGIEKLTILPAGGTLAHAAEIMGSPKMEQLVKELKYRYPDRYIIFDTPGLSSFPDPLVFSEYADAMLLVARADRTTIDAVESAMEIIPREKLIGTVLNDLVDLDLSTYYTSMPY